MSLEKYFKNPEEEESLQKEINISTLDRTVEIKNHLTETHKPIIDLIKTLGWQIDEIEEKIAPFIEMVPQYHNTSLRDLVAEFKITLEQLSNHLFEYAQTDLNFQEEFELYKKTSQRILIHLFFISDVVNKNNSLTEKLFTDWEHYKTTFFSTLKKVKYYLTHNVNDTKSLPPVYN